MEGYKTKAEIESTNSNPIYASETGEIFYYFGFKPIEKPIEIDGIQMPENPKSFCSASVGRNYEKYDKKNRNRYARLYNGALSWSGFLDDRGRFKEIKDKVVLFPTGTRNLFGVFEKGVINEDEEITRVLFGATQEELENLVRVYNRILNPLINKYVQPRVTFSKSDVGNTCDISDYIIPREMPYLTFEQINGWAHISLHGFYKHLNFLCSPVSRQETKFYRLLIDGGVEENLLKGISKRMSDMQFMKIIRE